ncbi:histone-lysine N-methyltransferase ASHH3 isoform X2 [Physcomitrium patens]|uniref:histone-lysine N-methyltransferase ASHH3 isoform X2 n=1 Tax=Physcomitrium patens TaxID=3218 RepID=UPI000D15521A|nr:histone-lysine N-methyltransferase ASHH3-like isoform X2 [Physcomitrium patens]|eukprot:XP_024374439.1 histone-lysine N-methyltransferase ASHH3-like isoform X2 [Physcomitrella patens]
MGRPKSAKIPVKDMPKEDGRKKGKRDDDGFAFICDVCSDFGELLCCERCRSGFHLSCLGLDKCPDVEPWLCSSCAENKVRCFKCKAFGSLEVDLVKCAHRNCGKYYHKDCSKGWVRIPPKKTDNGAMVCPRHHCDACRKCQKNAKLHRCLYCPVAYHESCSPEGTNLLEDIPGYLLCWKHDDEWKHEYKDAQPISDPKISLERLPLPNTAIDFQLPRAIFDAVRCMPNKPPSYCHIRRNIYLVKKSKRWQQDEKMECLCKPTVGSSETCSKDCLCGMLFMTCSSNCGCGDSCTNLPFQKLPGSKMKAVKTERCGWGLVADEDIKAGSFLVEYVGEVIDDQTCEERLWAMKKQGEMNFYMCEISREMVIDATFKGNLSRFINHSCQPNSELQKWDIDGETRIGVFAITDIKRGDFVTYDYQFIQFGSKNQHCHCGAPECRGQLGKPMKQQKASEDIAHINCALPQTLKKSNLCGNFSLKHAPLQHRHYQRRSASNDTSGDAGTPTPRYDQLGGVKLVGLRIKIWWPLDQKFYHGEVLSFDGSSGKHQVCYDDGEKEALCLVKERWEVESVDMCKKRVRRGSSTLDYVAVFNGLATSQAFSTIQRG